MNRIDNRWHIPKIVILVLSFFVSGQLIAQEEIDSLLIGYVGDPDFRDDTVNIEVTSSDLVLLDSIDSLHYIDSELKEINLSFNIAEIAGYESVQIELSEEGKSNKLRYRNSYTFVELVSSGMFSASIVTVNLGRYEPGHQYTVYVTFTHSSGMQGQTIFKTYDL